MLFTRSTRLCAPLVRALMTCTLVSSLFAQDVRTYHYNNAHTGWNASETILKPSNVNVSKFGKLFGLTVDGKVDAQPLYLSRLKAAGGTHNVLIVATENDSVYAFDADSGTLLWQVSVLGRGEMASDDLGCTQVTPTIGITATPVIIREGSFAAIYVAAMSKNASGTYFQRLHALNAATGKELYNGPVAISGKYPGTGDNSSGGYVIFDPSQYVERGALLYSNESVYLSWSSHCDNRPYTGWIMAYNPVTLAQQSVLDVTPNGNEGAIWGSGSGLTADQSGNIFFLDANGIFDSTLNRNGFPAYGDYGNAFVRLSGNDRLAVADYFEMYNGQIESKGDEDLGSGGAILLPTMQNNSGGTFELAAGAGKDGNLYIVNRNYMGKFNPNANEIYQELDGILPGGLWSMPAYFDGRLYYGPVQQPILAFQFTKAVLSGAAVAETSNSFGYPGATPSISSNGTQNGIVWAAENTNPAVLHAYNAATLAEIYNTNQASNGRDHFGAGNKFITPVIVNGKVYVGTTTGVGVFGLLSGNSGNRTP